MRGSMGSSKFVGTIKFVASARFGVRTLHATGTLLFLEVVVLICRPNSKINASRQIL